MIRLSVRLNAYVDGSVVPELFVLYYLLIIFFLSDLPLDFSLFWPGARAAMAALSSASPRILDGGGPRLFSGYSPRAPSTAGLPPGPDPHLLARYVVLFSSGSSWLGSTLFPALILLSSLLSSFQVRAVPAGRRTCRLRLVRPLLLPQDCGHPGLRDSPPASHGWF